MVKREAGPEIERHVDIFLFLLEAHSHHAHTAGATKSHFFRVGGGGVNRSRILVGMRLSRDF